MFDAIRARSDRDDEEGFTLIELMVVVLIIGILLAIAIPTFLGARDRANDRSAQSNLRNGLTAEKTLYTDASQYTDTSSASNIATLNGIEPSLTWTGVATSYPTRNVAVVVGGTGAALNTNVVLMDQSLTGTCFYIGDTSGPTGTPGTFYASSTASPCATAASELTSLMALTGAPTLAHANGAGAWALSF